MGENIEGTMNKWYARMWLFSFLAPLLGLTLAAMRAISAFGWFVFHGFPEMGPTGQVWKMWGLVGGSFILAILIMAAIHWLVYTAFRLDEIDKAAFPGKDS